MCQCLDTATENYETWTTISQCYTTFPIGTVERWNEIPMLLWTQILQYWPLTRKAQFLALIQLNSGKKGNSCSQVWRLITKRGQNLQPRLQHLRWKRIFLIKQNVKNFRRWGDAPFFTFYVFLRLSHLAPCWKIWGFFPDIQIYFNSTI